MGHEPFHQLDAAHGSGSFGSGIVVADAWLADRRYRMQDRVPRPVGIRIGAGVQQVGRQLEMSVRRRHEQRAGASRGWSPAVATSPSGLDRYRLVHVRPCLQQDLNDAEAAFSDGKQQRREPGAQTDTEIRPGIDERLRNFCVTLRRRPHQRRLPAPVVFTVNTSTAGEQRLHRVERARPRGRHQRGFPARKCGVRIRAGCQEPFDQRGVSIRAGQRERRDAIPVRRFHIGARAHQQVRGLQIVLIRRPVQRRHPISLGCVHVDMLMQERADPRSIHLFRRIRQLAEEKGVPVFA